MRHPEEQLTNIDTETPIMRLKDTEPIYSATYYQSCAHTWDVSLDGTRLRRHKDSLTFSALGNFKHFSLPSLILQSPSAPECQKPQRWCPKRKGQTSKVMFRFYFAFLQTKKSESHLIQEKYQEEVWIIGNLENLHLIISWVSVS